VSLRAKLLLAQIPLVAALVLLAVVASVTTASLGLSARAILSENYRSVKAAQQMKESIERLDDGALLCAMGRERSGLPLVNEQIDVFGRALAEEDANVTESGEAEAVRRLHASWDACSAAVGGLASRADTTPDIRAFYFDRLRPLFDDVRRRVDEILVVNQDAMVAKSDAAEKSARHLDTFLAVVALAGCVLGVGASAAMTTRLLRPLSVLGQTAKRIGEGDLAVRARVEGRDEIAGLAAEFNAMAERLESYRKSSLGELLEAQSAMQAAIDSLPDPVVVLAADRQVLRVNTAAERVLGIDPDASGAAALASVPQSLLDAIERARRHVLGGHGAYVPGGLEEAVRVGTSGGDVHLLTAATPVYSMEGAVVATTVVLQNVSRLVRSEERHTDLVATVAHEFRTPLTSLRMAIHLCTEQTVGPLTEKQADLLYAAREDCERLQTIVDEFLQVSRVHSGAAPVAKSAVDAEDLVRATIAAHERAAAERSVRLVSEALPGLPRVAADRERVLVALDNLVANAIRFAPSGSAVVVRARAAGDGVRFEVADGGPGIPSEYRESIFERNVRVPGSPGSGAGLGLFIARENVKANGGRIGVESEPGRGSTFWIELLAAR
jgi:NtrC-family two-component system sensor histidine kinase KinB